MDATKQFAALLCLGGILASGAALAEDKGFYVGYSAGQARSFFDGNPAIGPHRLRITSVPCLPFSRPNQAAPPGHPAAQGDQARPSYAVPATIMRASEA